MTLSQAINHSYSIIEPKESEIVEAIELLANMSIEVFSKQNILQGDVEALALADDLLVQHCASLVPVEYQSIDEHINPSKYAYHLAYSNPELATQLIDELLYYRNLGRI